MLTCVLEGGVEHTDESDNVKGRRSCGIPDNGVAFIFPKRLLCELLNGISQIIYTLLMLRKVLGYRLCYS